MTARPNITVPTWATDATYTSGAQMGQTTRNEPSAGVKAQGILPDTVASARRHNWLLGSQCDFLNWLAEAQPRNWVRVEVPSDFVSASAIRELLATSSYVYIAGSIGGSGDTGVFRSFHGDIWTDVSPSGLGVDTVNQTMCFGESVLLFAGEGATIGANIRRSVDSGTSWSTVATHAAATLGYSDIAHDGTDFYAAPVNPLSTNIGKSANGSSWAATAGSIPAGSHSWTTLQRCQIRAGSTGNLIVFQAFSLASTNLSHVIYTTNGGTTWVESGAIGSADEIYDIVYNQGTGNWTAMTDGGTFRSSDGGATWSLVGPPAMVSPGCLATDGGGLIFSASPVNSWTADEGVSWDVLQVEQLTFTLTPQCTYGAGRFWMLFSASPDFYLIRGLAL